MIALVDYGAGNLTSVKKALAAIDAPVWVPQSPDELTQASGVIVPGVGHFSVTRAIDQAWRDAIAGRTSFDHEHRIMIERGERWVRQLAEFQLNSSGEPVRAVGTTQDITERKLAEDARAQLEAQLRDSQKMEALGTLAGGIAHDFNNVLAAIMGNVELARQDVGRDHAACESLDEIARAAERAGSLVQKILAFSRRQVLETRAIDLTPVVKDTVRLLRATQPQGLLVDMQCRADTPVVMADAARISQALVNLCSAAQHRATAASREQLATTETQYTRIPPASRRSTLDGRTGYLIPWRCPEPFAEKIELLLRNEELRRALGQAAAERMRSYSWAEVARAVGGVLGALVGDRAVAAGGRLPA